MEASRNIARLIEIMAALRTPGTGCPWDLEQDFATIAPYTLEEAYEVADAIARGDMADLREELGDLLLQVVFHARMAQEQGAFDFGDVVLAITQKLLRRHPHVFGDARGLSPEGVKQLWDRIKTEEKAEKASAEPAGALAGVPVGLPALTRALKLQQKAGKVGFDWNDPMAVLAKIREEADEIEDAIKAGVRRGQSGAPPRRRPGGRAAGDQSEIRAPFRVDRAHARGARQVGEPVDARRDGRALGRGEGCRALATAARPPLGSADRRSARATVAAP